ncbi:hypothetical protein BBH99_00290 [Chryseobacterium contaminans]|uniref:DUF4007 domain-containing protein n=1 Tax=Chryseobacterium contaminans TaxID=1423959 RepID=A0A1M6VNF0_9FLAO|nr:DUF4007 family protein [Chryseobacterium contaminans]OCA80576.1 hypothetical protein BBH99_00290 [Chryseobacterium contaminans]SHK83033.1 Protein of unknown function [Chryseobacterium contaminans]
MLKFSGHDTFHCRQQWLFKGVQIIDNEGIAVFHKPEIAISRLGVGRNMVQSIQHWLKAFGLINENHEISEFSEKIFLAENKYDPFLVDEGTLWLLQYKICHTNYASIFNLIFSEFFNDKISLEFSETQVKQFIAKKIRDRNIREVSDNTLSSDFKVFVKSYANPIKSLKTIEDDFNSPFLELNLISQLSHKNALGETVYRINRESQKRIPTSIFAYCILDYLGGRIVVSYDEIRDTIGSYFCLSNDGLDELVDSLCLDYKEFIYKNDAGIRQLQIKNITEDYQNNLLELHYGL